MTSLEHKKAVIAELWRRGETDFLLHGGQLKIEQAFKRSRHRVFGVECARQLGKSFWGVKKADQIARLYPGSSSRIGTAFYTDLDAIILPAFEKVVATCPSALRPKHKTIGAKFVYPNGSDIRLVGLDRNPDKLRGSRLRLVMLEEAGFGDSDALRYAHDSVIVPAFTHEPDAQCVLISTPPQQGNDHSFCELVDEAALHDSYLKLTIHDNPMLSPERVAQICEDLGGPMSVAWRREALCERIVDTERAIIPEWREEFEFDELPEDPERQFWHKYQFMDIGIQVDKTVCLFGYYNFRQARLYITHEVDISGTKTTTDLIAKTLTDKEIETGYQTTYRRIADNSHPLLLNDLSAKGIHFVATDKAHLHEMVGELRVWVKQGRVHVHKRCKQTLGCLRTGIWDRPRKAFERSKVLGHYDALAALVYGVRNVDQFSNPIPDWFVNPARWVMPGKKPENLSPLGKDLKGLFSHLK
jgi:hypothetical protein